MGKLIDLTGKRFGRLIILNKTNIKNKFGYIQYDCICDCGNHLLASRNSLIRGLIKSCGCLHSQQSSENIVSTVVENTNLGIISKKTLRKNNSSGIRGVNWNKNRKCWVAELQFQGQKVFRKGFKNKQDAINARKEAEEKYFKPILEKYDYEKSC